MIIVEVKPSIKSIKFTIGDILGHNSTDMWSFGLF